MLFEKQSKWGTEEQRAREKHKHEMEEFNKGKRQSDGALFPWAFRLYY